MRRNFILIYTIHSKIRQYFDNPEKAKLRLKSSFAEMLFRFNRPEIRFRILMQPWSEMSPASLAYSRSNLPLTKCLSEAYQKKASYSIIAVTEAFCYKILWNLACLFLNVGAAAIAKPIIKLFKCLISNRTRINRIEWIVFIKPEQLLCSFEIAKSKWI